MLHLFLLYSQNPIGTKMSDEMSHPTQLSSFLLMRVLYLDDDPEGAREP